MTDLLLHDGVMYFVTLISCNGAQMCSSTTSSGILKIAHRQVEVNTVIQFSFKLTIYCFNVDTMRSVKFVS